MCEDGAEAPGWHESVFVELRGLAERALSRESAGQSLQPTILVNDAYLKLLEQRNVRSADRSLVLAAGAKIIRRLLVDHARRRKAQKRGGEKGRGASLEMAVADSSKSMDIIELNDALQLLARDYPRAASVVELQFFGGLTGEDIAANLNISLRTVRQDWRFAKAWLYQALSVNAEEATG